jgi:signal peptide peptidase SppA
MKPIDVLNSPWAIVPEKLLEICEIYSTHLRGEKIDIAKVEAQLGRPLNNRQDLVYANDGGTAIIPIEGVISKKMNLFTQISGGTSSQFLGKAFQEAMSDPDVHSIILAIDSPGGTVDGTQPVAEQIFAARGKKPIVAFADGMMASAAYWIGSAADQVFISSDTDQIGSIGVVATHVDYSKADEKYGVKVTDITAGKYKRVASQHAPLSEEGRKVIQDGLDHIYSIFVDSVARHRGMSTEAALESADGKVFLGKKAISANLADGVSTIDALVEQLNQDHAKAYKGAVAQIISERKEQWQTKSPS